MTGALIPARTADNAAALDWLAARQDGPEAAFLRRLLSREPARMGEDWTSLYGWESCWRWFASDAEEGGRPMDIPRFLVKYLPGGIHRGVTSCIDYPSRREALTALATAFLTWLAVRLREADHVPDER